MPFNTKETILRLINNLLFSYSTLLFLKSRMVGLFLLAATLININLAVSGIISWLTTIIFARFIGIRKDDVVHTVYTYNSLIVGFSIGFLFKVSMLSALITIGTSVLTVMLSYAFYAFFTIRWKMPVLNMPFVIVSTIIYLASIRYSSLFVDSFYHFERWNLDVLPFYIQGLLRSSGVLIFMPYDLSGALILAALLVFSRIAFFLAVSSYYIGILFLSALKGSPVNACMDISAFNFILIGVALGGVFLIPSKRSYLLAFTGVFVSVFILDAISVFWSAFGIPVFTFPFNLVVLLFVFVLGNIGYPLLNPAIKSSPEKSLSDFLNFTKRFDYVTPQPFLPFYGQWRVYQGFDGEWTHQGPWKHAYDFVIVNSYHKTFKNQGQKPEDYLCFGKPILSPVNGTVVDALDSLPDNPIGQIDKQNNWGNYVIIYSNFGYYTEISHLKMKSLKVRIGDSVKLGSIIASCGNSGNSPQPHIHMQVQRHPKLGSATVPFYFSQCMSPEKKLIGNENLATNISIEPVTFSRKLYRIFSFILDDSFDYIYFVNEIEISRIRVTAKMDMAGMYYFHLDETDDRLYFGNENNRFVFFSFEGNNASCLKFMFAAAPKIPLSIDNGLHWEETLPINLLFSLNKFQLFYKSFNHSAHTITGNYRFADNRLIEGVITNDKQIVQTRAIIDNHKGFKEIQVTQSNINYRLVRDSS